MSNQKLREAISLSKAGDKAEARKILEALIEQDPQNEMVWIWMTDVVDSDDEKRYCLEIVLSLNPDSLPAKAGIQYLGGATTPTTFDESFIPTG